MKIIGVEDYKFKDKETGKEVEGCSIHCVTTIDPKRGVGYALEKKYSISADKFAEILPCAPHDLLNKEVFLAIEKDKVKKIILQGK